jgi:hypothetical protein
MCNVDFKDMLNFMTVEMDLASDMLKQGGKVSFNLQKQRAVCQGLTYRPQKIRTASTSSCMLYCYGNPFLAKSVCAGTHLKLCLSRISSPSFTFSVIINVIHSLTAES